MAWQEYDRAEIEDQIIMAGLFNTAGDTDSAIS
jgi:hypothetical protein